MVIPFVQLDFRDCKAEGNRGAAREIGRKPVLTVRFETAKCCAENELRCQIDSAVHFLLFVVYKWLFRDVTIKEIAQYTSLSRPSIYNYFETKEEIFLAILQREYELWIKDIEGLIAGHEKLTRDELAHELAASLERRELLLKLMSMNHYDMEANSSMERLTRFKTAYGNSIKTVDRLLQTFCPDLTVQGREEFLYSFFPFIYGVYPYAVVTDKQKEAMKQANTDFVFLSIYELIYRCTKKLLGA